MRKIKNMKFERKTEPKYTILSIILKIYNPEYLVRLDSFHTVSEIGGHLRIIFLIFWQSLCPLSRVFSYHSNWTQT